MQGKLYLKNAAALTLSGLVLRVLGMLFRIYLAAMLGAEGMGLYQLVLSVYMIFVSLATAGVNVASTRLAAQSLARGRGMARTVGALVTAAALFGTAAMLAQFALANILASWFLRDARAVLSLRLLAPSLPFMAVAGALRGCFLAARRVGPNVTAQLVEQLVRMAVVALLLTRFGSWGAGYACAAVLAGNTVSEAVSCLLMVAFAGREPAFAAGTATGARPFTGRAFFDIVLPVEGSRFLASGLQAAESALIPYTLALYHGSRAVAMAEYGGLKGMALPLLFFPFSVLSALSGLLMPEITRAHTVGDTAATKKLISAMLRLTGAFSLLAGVGFVAFGAPLAGLLYGDAQVGAYVRVLGFVAPFMYLESMVDGVLKGLGEQLATFRYSLADSVLRIAAIWFLLPRYGMAAFLGVMIASNLFTFACNFHRMAWVVRHPKPQTDAE